MLRVIIGEDGLDAGSNISVLVTGGYYNTDGSGGLKTSRGAECRHALPAYAVYQHEQDVHDCEGAADGKEQQHQPAILELIGDKV